MKENQKLWNNKSKKIAYFVSKEKEYTRVRINGLVAMVNNADFDKYYEIVNE